MNENRPNSIKNSTLEQNTTNEAAAQSMNKIINYKLQETRNKMQMNGA